MNNPKSINDKMREFYKQKPIDRTPKQTITSSSNVNNTELKPNRSNKSFINPK